MADFDWSKVEFPMAVICESDQVSQGRFRKDCKYLAHGTKAVGTIKAALLCFKSENGKDVTGNAGRFRILTEADTPPAFFSWPPDPDPAPPKLTWDEYMAWMDVSAKVNRFVAKEDYLTSKGTIQAGVTYGVYQFRGKSPDMTFELKVSLPCRSETMWVPHYVFELPDMKAYVAKRKLYADDPMVGMF